MTSKAELQRRASEFSRSFTEASERALKAERALEAYVRENEALYARINGNGDANATLVQFIDDLYVIEPQLQHTKTNGAWDFERVHRAAEALRNEDALASVGYTDQCVEWPDNVTPLFPRGPEGAAA